MNAANPIHQLRDEGYCVLRARFPLPLVEACRDAFWPVLLAHLAALGGEPNRGPRRYFLPMPFDPPCFAPEFFFDAEVLRIVRVLLGDRIVADQWGCDVPLRGSEHQQPHVDYRRPLFEEAPDLPLPAYILAVSFPLARIGPEHGPIEIAPGTHRLPRPEGIAMQPVLLEPGDVLIRHPWALHRGTPNLTETPRALVTIRYVRRWYADDSREVSAIPRAVWSALTPAQQLLLRFPVEA